MFSIGNITLMARKAAGPSRTRGQGPDLGLSFEPQPKGLLFGMKALFPFGAIMPGQAKNLLPRTPDAQRHVADFHAKLRDDRLIEQ